MSSRQKKQARREDRLARERAVAAAAARRRRLQLVAGGGLATVLIAGVIVGIVLAVAGDSGGGRGSSAAAAARATLPPQRITDLRAAARAAGCTLRTVEDLGGGHSEKAFRPADYDSNPPTSGEHNPSWYQDGIYAPGSTPELGRLVHTIEHGRIDVQYRQGTPRATVARLEALHGRMGGGYHLLLFENTTGMPYAVAATAWTQLLGCPRMNDRVFDAIRAFRTRYIDRGPERVP